MTNMESSPNVSSTPEEEVPPVVENIVYVVDDDEPVRDSLQWLLEANGYHVKCYASAEQFLNGYEPGIVSVLIADIRMPGMSGLELQEVLIQRDNRKSTRLNSSHVSISYAVFCLKKKKGIIFRINYHTSK